MEMDSAGVLLRLTWLFRVLSITVIFEARGTSSDMQALSNGMQSEIRCAYTGQQKDLDFVGGVGGEATHDNGTQLCRPKSENGVSGSADRLIGCFAVWSVEKTEEGAIFVVKNQGCNWGHSGDNRTCLEDRCIDQRGLPLNNTYYCCCSTPMCNSEANLSISISPVSTTEPLLLGPDGTAAPVPAGEDFATLVAVLVTLGACCFAVALGYFIYRKTALRHAPKRLLMAAAEAASGTSHSSCPASRVLSPVSASGQEIPLFGAPSSGGLKMDSLLHHGKFGEVWRAVLEDRSSVCVKVFNPSQRTLFHNERDIYSLPLIQHEAIVRCLAAEERRPGGSLPLSAQYVIVMEYHPLGSLNSYLKTAKGSLSFQTLCAMCHSIAAGLGHLHLEVLGSTLGGVPGGPHKPAIVHRDLNSRNILVKNDLTCAIADMGFALKIKGSKYCRNGQEENIEEASLRDVGTVRYMAPEILDGAVNLRECETSLKQIDVYALGLVLWEVATQCCDLYAGHRTTQAYRMPYEDEVGINPTYEEMQMLVSKNRQRPAFPATWKDGPVVQSLKETIQDCWDYDAEARLTALCVQERFKEFSTTSDLHGRPMSVIALNQNIDSKIRTSCAPVGNAYGDHAADREEKETSPLLGSSLMQSSCNVTTAVPGNAEALPKQDVNVELDQSRRQQQTIAGRNSLISRNTMQPSVDEIMDVVGNTLIRRAAPGQLQQGSGCNSSSLLVVAHSTTTGDAGGRPTPAPRHSGSFCNGAAASASGSAAPSANGPTLRNSSPANDCVGNADGRPHHGRMTSDVTTTTTMHRNGIGLQKKVPNWGGDGVGEVRDRAASQSSQGVAALGSAASSGNDGSSSASRSQQQRPVPRPDSLALKVCTK